MSLDHATVHAVNQRGPFRPDEISAINAYKDARRPQYGRTSRIATRYADMPEPDQTFATRLTLMDDGDAVTAWNEALQELDRRLDQLHRACGTSSAAAFYYLGQRADYAEAATAFAVAHTAWSTRLNLLELDRVLDDERVWLCGCCSEPLDRVEATVGGLLCYGCAR